MWPAWDALLWPSSTSINWSTLLSSTVVPFLAHSFLDFACGTKEWLLNRSIGYGSGTSCWVDTVHHHGHTCSSYFSSKANPLTANSNTSVLESINSSFAPSKANLLYMKATTGARFLNFLSILVNLKDSTYVLPLSPEEIANYQPHHRRAAV